MQWKMKKILNTYSEDLQLNESNESDDSDKSIIIPYFKESFCI